MTKTEKAGKTVFSGGMIEMSNNSNKNDFIAQAGILAAAGIITRIIGLLYRSPLTAIVGELGIGYYQSAYNFYTLILLISSYSIPGAISKVISQKLALKEYKNAHRFFYGAMAYVLVVGGIASLFLFFGAEHFVEKTAVPVLRVFAPTIFIYGILGVLRGYFQAHRSMSQTSLSQIIEQIVNAVISILGAYLLIRFTMGSLAMPNAETDRINRAVYGAIGSALGTGGGVLAGLVFMGGMYLLNRKMFRKRILRDQHEIVDSYATIVRTITLVVTPFILSTAIQNLSGVANNYIYTKLLPTLQKLDSVQRYTNWGIFSGQSMTVSNIPIAFASAMAAAMLPSVAQLMATNQVETVKEKIGVAIKSTMMISIPCAVGLFVLAKPVMFFLFPRADEVVTIAARLLMMLSLSVVFYALSTLNSQILQGLGRLNAPIINAGFALVIQTVVAVILLLYTDLDLYSMAIANTLYSGMMCALNQYSVYRAIGYKQEWKYTFLIPALASVVMGGVAYGTYKGLYLVTHSMRVSLLPAVLVAAIVYFVVMIKGKGLSEQELRGFPKGYLLVKLAKKCKVL